MCLFFLHLALYKELPNKIDGAIKSIKHNECISNAYMIYNMMFNFMLVLYLFITTFGNNEQWEIPNFGSSECMYWHKGNDQSAPGTFVRFGLYHTACTYKCTSYIVHKPMKLTLKKKKIFSNAKFILAFWNDAIVVYSACNHILFRRLVSCIVIHSFGMYFFLLLLLFIQSITLALQFIGDFRA